MKETIPVLKYCNWITFNDHNYDSLLLASNSPLQYTFCLNFVEDLQVQEKKDVVV